LLGQGGSPIAAHALRQSVTDSQEQGLPKVEIYTKLTCGFCYRAKKLLEMKKVPFEEYSVDFGGAKKAEMIDRASGRMTVPQIFINGRHVGGCDELMALEYQGKLDELLAA
jgi:glutaredoxin 3